MTKRVKIITGVITPFPISGYVSKTVNKVALRYMFAANGKVTIGAAYFEEMPASGVDIFLNIHRGDDVNSTSIFTKEKFIVIEPDIEVKAGDRLVISIAPKGAEKVSGIWTSFLWVPTTKDAEIKQFVISELERIEKEGG